MVNRPMKHRVHDLGGSDGFGPIPIDDLGPFHADWEGRAFAITQFAQAASGFTTDAFRHGIEREDPGLYLTLDYWEKWARNAERMVVEGGVLAADAVDAALRGVAPIAEPVRTTDVVPPTQRSSEAEPPASPRFQEGATVRVGQQRDDGGHTRLPGYVVGQVGVVVANNGGWIFPDTHAHGAGIDPQWVYLVDFLAADLWPNAGQHHVRVDLFEPYLEHA